ncbi:MAG: DNA polymerase III subunit beta [Bacteroides sp.]|nr:DNA polymerase III subunit beta [Bacteroides sp.]MDD2645333.1 DNA polymerase III subunit beta [Bacteroides sp.]MDD4055983.1 DNA polymerase III subunit beta [Bacteroides sp.]MDD4720460.1 DNA polymerase III subunit beta [Bacteroides sp.]NLI64106.1 DNA polymerase III subunit beta [Bacteroidales bacterium]
MKFIVSSTSLFSHLQAVGRVINAKNTLPILDCFLFQMKDSTLSITASDGETTMVTSVEVNQSSTDGDFAINAKTILDALKEVPEQPLTFEISLETLEITVQYQNGQYSLMGQNAEDFPQLVELNEDKMVELTMEPDVLLDGFNRTVFATADDELRPVMNGVYFDITESNITLVASDGHKLVRYQVDTPSQGERSAFILPKKPANLLRNILTKEHDAVTISFDERNAVFLLKDFRLVCRLIEGRYPNYNSVIPQNNPFKIIIDRQLFIGALRRVSIFSSQASSLIKLHLENNEVKISAQDIDFSTSAEEVQSCQYEGTPMSIGFKSTFLIDILNNISSDEIIMELADPSRAGVIFPTEQEDGKNILMLLMPMMLND